MLRIKDKKEVAVKMVNIDCLNNRERAQLKSEINIMRRVCRDSEFIVQYEDAFQQIMKEGIKEICIVMEYCEAGDLKQLI